MLIYLIKYPGGKRGPPASERYKRLLYMVGFLEPSGITSRWTTLSTGYCNCAIQDGVQDGRRIYKMRWWGRFSSDCQM